MPPNETAPSFTDEDRARVEGIPVWSDQENADQHGGSVLSPDDDDALTRALAYIEQLETRVKELEEALRLIATPPRPDGTYNRSREACEELARAYLAADGPAPAVREEARVSDEARERAYGAAGRAAGEAVLEHGIDGGTRRKANDAFLLSRIARACVDATLDALEPATEATDEPT